MNSNKRFLILHKASLTAMLVAVCLFCCSTAFAQIGIAQGNTQRLQEVASCPLPPRPTREIDCPETLLFVHFGIYYHSVFECPGAEPQNMLFGYEHDDIVTGCNGNGCNETRLPYVEVDFLPLEPGGGGLMAAPGNGGDAIQKAAVAPDAESIKIPADKADETKVIDKKIGDCGTFGPKRVKLEDRYFVVMSFVDQRVGDPAKYRRTNFAIEFDGEVPNATDLNKKFDGKSISYKGLKFKLIRKK